MGRYPSWGVGQMRNCDICGDWHGEREGKFRTQRGLEYVCPKCFDQITEEERQQDIQRRIR